MSKLLIQCLFFVVWFVKLDCQNHVNRPKIITQNGEIIIEAAYNKNIVLRPNGPSSAVVAGDVNLLQSKTSDGDEAQPSTNTNDFQKYFSGPNSILSRLEKLENQTTSLPINTNLSPTYLLRRVNRLHTRVTELQRRMDELATDGCASNPCQKGGTCLTIVNGYHCLCPSNWEGKNCDIDVNECRNFAGTELGCQNGATCINLPGTYKCACTSGWYGLHCTRREKDCSQGNSEMCGHGVCIPSTSGKGFTCLCDQGWETNGTGVECLTDINECDARHGPRCSVNPKVECVNWPGSFRCGQCPAGYEGDGFTCSDINECLTIPNGGCSSLVTCHNTIGSRICGPCPQGYDGDGVTCTWRGSCNMNHGGCHPSAQCLDHMSIVQCVCPLGMDGDGVGIHGCYISTTENFSRGCEDSPCGIHGQCHKLLTGYTCLCLRGYSGAHCEIAADSCSHNPCQNGGTCKSENSATGYRCECTAQYTGNLCQMKVMTCGGYLDSEEGSIIYPLTNTSYSDNSKCAWVIHTIPSKVINVTFTKFNLEPEPECLNDFLQIHDGRTSSSQLIGRFCGNELPKGGKIISSHNSLYFWFRSDDTRAGSGFALHWNSIDPVCGGEINASTHGVISSPGSPGKYPPNRDCYWYLSTAPSKRISLSFFTLDIESHANCSYDFLAIYNGRRGTDPLINKYCHSTQPQPVTSTSSDIMIHFHSDSHGNGHGFQISYAPVEGLPGCGGLYTLDKGEIISPSYNGRYLENLRCEYKISTGSNTKIRIEFKQFELEVSPRCRYDYVKVYDGPSTESKLIGKFCGKSNYPKHPIESTSNNLVIIFRTDRNINYGGFKISFETFCYKSLFGDSGTITSPGYPFPYPSNKDCEYVISTIPGKAIQLTFNDFNMEDSKYYNCMYDYVEIRDGPDRNATLLGKFCGSQRYPPQRTSTHNFIYVRFHSDLSNPSRTAYTGFSASYTTLDTTCGGIYKENTGIINHPRTGEKYEKNQECKWWLIAPAGMHIKLSWTSFKLEDNTLCTGDYLELIEVNEMNEEESVGKFCGSVTPPSLTTTTTRLVMKFKSDYSEESTGFSVAYHFVDASKSCGGTYLSTHGIIYSPGWPKRYETNRICKWIIQVPVGQQITLNISNFDLEQPLHHKCDTSDYLEIRNGVTESSPMIGKYCGRFTSKRVTSLTNALYLHFYSDFYLTGDGFKIEWTSSANRCGGTLTSSSGSIASPNYPEKYNNNEECFFKIIINPGSRISISFSVLELENTIGCRDDYVAIFDGNDENSPSLGKHCFMKTELNNIQTSSNVAFIKFRTDFYTTGKGFLLNYNSICRNNITGSYGVIESPDYPGNYPSNADCLWTINVPKGHKINITFTSFNLHRNHAWGSWGWRRYYNTNCMDYVQLKSSNQLDFSSKYCGTSKPPIRTTVSNFLQIKFVTGNSFPQTGFRLEWVSVGCGGFIQKNVGSINLDRSTTSDGEMECQWIIEGPLGKKVTIEFDNIYMSESNNCTVDSIEIFNGPDTNAPLISKFCNHFKDIHKFQTTTNYMLIRFTKRSDLKDVHFSSTFSTLAKGCGGAIRSHSGLIYSPNYPKNYDNDMDCIWTIIVPKNHRIELNFIFFDLYAIDDLVSCSDSVKIYDTARIRIANYTREICANMHISQVISKSNIMAVQLTTDSSGTAKGFKANFTVICGATINATADGIITNDKYLSLSNRSCVWTIKAPVLNQHVTLTITHMSIAKTSVNVTNRSCPSSFLRVLDGDNEDAPLINEYCGSYTPRIVSRGSALTVVLGTYTDRIEGEFTAHYSSLDNACGGIISSENGEIASPNYPSPYPPDSDCEWTIHPSPGNQVYITFEDFDLESSEDCNQDYVEIRENNGAGRLLTVYCGSDKPTNTTVAPVLYVKFRSVSTGSKKGFLFKYGLLHGVEISGLESGEVASPLYPHLFGTPGVYTWKIILPEYTIIRLKLTHLEINTRGESCTNNLKIFDGYDDEASELESLCGVLRNEEKTIQTYSNVALIKLTLDESNTGTLFYIFWSKATVDTSETDSAGYKINCGSKKVQEVLPGNASYFTSPNYPEPYAYDHHCEWTFKTSNDRHLELTFPTFHIEMKPRCYADYVSVYSSDTAMNWKPVKTGICTKEETVGLNSSTYMKINFDADSSDSKQGFRGRVKSVCGGTRNDKSGTIRPSWFDWRDSYGQIECNWLIKVRPGRHIDLYFFSFNITNEKTDCRTYVILRNGESSESPLLSDGKYCGFTHEPSRVIHTTGNALYVSYRTSKSGQFKSFTIYYEEKNFECGSTITLNEEHNAEIINSPNYPSVPVSFSECVWTITGPPGEILRFEFIDRFDMDSRGSDCSMEYVELRDGATEFAPILGRYCSEKPGTIKTKGNHLYIKYSTQVSEPRNGFRANVSIDVCGGTIVASEGELSSPGYPHMAPLPAGTVCKWQLTGIMGRTFMIKAQDIILPLSESPCGSKITIEEHIPENNTVAIIKTFCYEDFPNILNEVVQTLTNQVTIKMHIGKLSTYSQISHTHGFRLTFNSTMPSCAGIITTPEGYLSTPSYPRQSTIRYCHWKIVVPDETRRVSLELLDFDAQRQRIGIYSVNDGIQVTNIETIPSDDYDTSITKFESTGNNMIVYIWLSGAPGTTHRFQAKFNSDSPALCGGVLSGTTGNLVSPSLNRSYTCKWRYNTESNNLSNTIVLKAQLNSSTNTYMCRRVDPNLVIKYYSGNGKDKENINICSRTETVYRIPSNSIDLLARKNKQDSLYFNLEWKTQPCGGNIIASENPVNVLNITSSFNDTIDCAWLISAPIGRRVQIINSGSFQFDCSNEFVKVYPNSLGSSVVIGDYCKDKNQDSPLLAEFSRLYIEYHSKARNVSNMQIMVSLTTDQNQCGNVMMHESTFSSPNYPKQYAENIECAWEINADLGSRISLQFIDRFAIEGQPGSCTADAVIIYDWKDNEYTEVARLCGREPPQPYNSTFNKMKIVFRTNDKFNLDGFKAKWVRICGGTYIATESVQFLYSPSYHAYPPNMNCVYNITAEKEFYVKFLDFALEGPYPDCGNDNLTIEADASVVKLSFPQSSYIIKTYASPDPYEYYQKVFCGNEIPEPLYVRSHTMTFKSDSFISRKGFKLAYFIPSCGNTKKIKKPTVLKSSETDQYDDEMNCTWKIEAPHDKNVVLTFIMFDLESTYSCSGDYLVVYDGLDFSVDKQLAILCGSTDNDSPMVIKSTKNTMSLMFITDMSMQGKGFEIAVSFSYSESVGCGGHINLTSNAVIKSPIFGSQVVYENYLDCIWTVSAPEDYIVKINFTSFHIAPCEDANQTALGINKCDCDYVQLRDGVLTHSPTINKYCGHTAPMEVSSSGNTLSVILHTDGEVVSSGFLASLKAEESVCGQRHYSVNDVKTVIKSPGYDSKSLPRGIHCVYNIDVPEFQEYSTTYLRINIDIKPETANKCVEDKLIISRYERLGNSTLGNDYVLSFDNNLSYENGDSFYLAVYEQNLDAPSSLVLCGNRTLDIYLVGKVKLKLQTSPSDTSVTAYRGIQIEVVRNTHCTRNFTEPYGRIRNIDNKDYSRTDCYTLITAPENHTVSAYFLSVAPTMYSNDEISLEIYDGKTTAAKRLKKIDVDYNDILTAFSTGRNMLIYSKVMSDSHIGYDLSYVSSVRYPGCGGKIANVIGRITSPMYPDSFRKKTTCEWEIETPTETQLVLRFTTFDLGVACDQVYVQLVDRNNNVISEYCEETPADYRSPDNYVKVVFVTTRNNVGTGWVAEFLGIKKRE